MGLVGDVMNAFEIVIQAGALLAVLWLYRVRVLVVLRGLARPRSPGGLLLLKLVVAFLPAAALGLLLHHKIEEHLFGPRPLAPALFLGGVVMVVFERRPPAPGLWPP